MSLKKIKRIGISIDMTPMVDVAFLLLIFFMTTTQFKPPERDRIELPKSSSDLKAPQSNTITISIIKDGRLGIDYVAQAHKVQTYVPDIEQLRSHLQTARTANPGARILVKADQAAKYGLMQDVMQMLQDENATRFNIVTDLKGGAGLLATSPAKH
jgi:biopolymer transport protein ExbD